jgi:FHS family L-fucose permease-like MFS transporter
MPYLAFFAVFVLLAAIFFFVRLPDVGESKIEPGFAALKFPHVDLGILAIFMYVGGEVAVGSSIINFLGQPAVAGLTQIEASVYVSLFWFGMLIGRFMGAVELSDLAPRAKKLLLAGIPLGAAAVLVTVRGWSTTQMYLPFLVLCWLLFQSGKARAGRTLMIFSCAIVALLGTAIVAGGKLAMWCVIGAGLFTSIGWSNTFSLAIEGTGIYKSQASSLLVMAILGGAILPPIQGRLADHFGLQLSYLVPLVAYAYVAFYGWKGHRLGRRLIP